MIQGHNTKERIKYFLLGVMVIVGAIVLMGAADSQVVIENGRYQISAWGDGKAHGAFIVDTVTGKTKMAYQYSDQGDGKSLEKNNLNKPFNKIRH